MVSRAIPRKKIFHKTKKQTDYIYIIKGDKQMQDSLFRDLSYYIATDLEAIGDHKYSNAPLDHTDTVNCNRSLHAFYGTFKSPVV